MNKILVSLIAALALVASASMAQAAVIVYDINLSGPAESPPNTSLGTGVGTVTIDDIMKTMAIDMTFSGLTGTTTMAHIHAATPVPFAMTAGVATTTPSFAGFPIGVTAGAFSNTLDMTLASSYNPSYVSAHGGTTAQAFTDLNQAIIDGKAYFNIHTNTSPGGEIRSFLVAEPVPEPTSMSLIALGCTLGLARRRRK
jgi:hypothetical protein